MLWGTAEVTHKDIEAGAACRDPQEPVRCIALACVLQGPQNLPILSYRIPYVVLCCQIPEKDLTVMILAVHLGLALA